ncbi:MAG: hypothetical protein V5783_06975 [Pontiella sp.]
MKKIDFKNNPFLAFLLSFFFPGIGMWYLKCWGKGLVNMGILIPLWMLLSPMEIVPVFIPLLVGIASGAWAYLEADGRPKNPAD